MFASYRLEISPKLYGSEGSLSVNNTLELPDDKLSLHSFKTVILNAVEELLPKIFETYLANEELKMALQERLSNEASLFVSDPPAEGDPTVNYTDEEELRLDETELAAGALDDEEWLERYSHNF